MKKYIYLLLAASLTMGLTSCNKKGSGASPVEDSISTIYGQGMGAMVAQQLGNPLENGMKIDKEAYLTGLQKALLNDTTVKGRSFQYGYGDGAQLLQNIQAMEAQGIHIDRAALLKAFKKAYTDAKPADQAKMMQLQQKLQDLMMKAQNQSLKKAEQEGIAFLKNQEASDKSLKKTKSGMLYKIVKPGNGKTFKYGQSVMTKYVGMHIDGKIFDKADKAVPFKIDNEELIKGFIEILQLMSPGAKAHVIIPASLGYGERGNMDGNGKQVIKPNEVLVFDIETGNLAPETPADK